MKIDQFTLRTLTDHEKTVYQYLLKRPNDNGVVYVDIDFIADYLGLTLSDTKKALSDLEGKALINQSIDFTKLDDEFAWVTILEKVAYNEKTKSPLEYFQNIRKIPNDVLEDLIYTINEGA